MYPHPSLGNYKYGIYPGCLYDLHNENDDDFSKNGSDGVDPFPTPMYSHYTSLLYISPPMDLHLDIFSPIPAVYRHFGVISPFM